MPWPPNSETRRWRKAYASDVENRATSVGIAQQRKDPQRAPLPRVTPQLGHQHRQALRKRRWVGKSCTLTSKALQHKWMKRRKRNSWTKLKKRVFNSEGCFNVNLSCLRHLLCKNRKDYVEFDISSYFDNVTNFYFYVGLHLFSSWTIFSYDSF